MTDFMSAGYFSVDKSLTQTIGKYVQRAVEFQADETPALCSAFLTDDYVEARKTTVIW